MTDEEVTDVLERFERRLANLAAQAYQTCEQAKKTFEQLDRLSREVSLLKADLRDGDDTGVYRTPSIRPVSSRTAQEAGAAPAR